jgi:hypothetical protein
MIIYQGFYYILPQITQITRIYLDENYPCEFL